MDTSESRRQFLKNASIATAGLVVSGHTPATSAQEHKSHAAGASTETGKDEHAPEHTNRSDDSYPRFKAGPGGPVGSPTDRGKLVSGFRAKNQAPVLVTAPDLEKLPWQEKDGAKEFHLVAQHVRREVLPGLFFDLWGYNGTAPGPTIEAVEGDRVRIIVHNDLPESTTVHWHGIELPVSMDGVEGLTQDPIPAGGMFTYEFDLHQNGTFFYHSHGAMQEVMGMTGLFIVHPRIVPEPAVDHDFALVVQEFAVLPQSTIPNSISEEFNFFTINGRSGPFVTPLVVRLGSRVRIRFMNLSAMDHHPMHLHGHTFWITGTEGGRIPETAWIPTNNVLVGVGQSRDVEFIANNPGDWMIHCHIPHHMMNHMVSMVGPMVSGGDGSEVRGPVIPEMKGSQLSSGEIGAGLKPSLGPMTAADRATMNGMKPADMAAKTTIPGYPQDMMEMMGMLTPKEQKAINVPLTRGMRRNWPMAVHAMMTVLRVLPDDLYEKVIAGKEEVPAGASVPGAGEEKEMTHQHSGHQMNQDSEMDQRNEGSKSEDAGSTHSHTPMNDGAADEKREKENTKIPSDSRDPSHKHSN